MVKTNSASAVKHINTHGALLLFPLTNLAQPHSLWRCFFPRTRMRWEWTEDADNKVVTLWHLREELSRSRKVIYSKFYQNRATFLSIPLFTALLSYISKEPAIESTLSKEAFEIYSVLTDDSPLATKELRSIVGYSGGHFTRAFEKGMRELWSKLLIVGFGEKDEGGFPSLAVGASKVLFEDQWDSSLMISELEADKIISSYCLDAKFKRQIRQLQVR